MKTIVLPLLLVLLCSCASVHKDAPIAMLSESAQATVIGAINFAVQQKVVSPDDGKRALDELFHRGVDWAAILTTISSIGAAIAGSLLGVRLQRGMPTQRVGLPAAMVQGLADALKR